MKRKIACLVVLASVVTILLLLFRQNINTEMLNGIMYFFGVVAFITFLFGVAERAQLYRFWPKGEIFNEYTNLVQVIMVDIFIVRSIFGVCRRF